MVATSIVSEYIDRQVAAFKKIALRDFLIEFQSKFYHEQDISFMDYFLELSKKENEGQFIVPHEKLIEYGVLLATGGSSDIKKRLSTLGLAMNIDYVFRKVSENSQKGGRPQNIYMLTPDSFKLALTRANDHKKHSINVDKYARYYLFLEKVVGYYMEYQVGLEKALSNVKDGTISELRSDIRELKNINLDQTSKIDALMVYAADTNATIHALDLSNKRKSHLSTVVLANKKLENYYGSTMMLLYDKDQRPYIRVQNMRCPRKDLLPTMKNFIHGTYSTNKNIPVKALHSIAIPPIYFPNAVTLLIKVVERFEKIVRKQKISEFNKEFNDEIKSGSVERLTVKNFPVKMTRLFFEYHPNNVMTFNEVIMLVVDMIKQSQGCALDLPATKQLQMLSDKQSKLIEKRFVEKGTAAQKELFKEVNADIARASRDLADNIFKGVFETPSSSDDSNQDEDNNADNEESDLDTIDEFFD